MPSSNLLSMPPAISTSVEIGLLFDPVSIAFERKGFMVTTPHWPPLVSLPPFSPLIGMPFFYR